MNTFNLQFSKVFHAMHRYIKQNCTNDDDKAYQTYFFDRLYGSSVVEVIPKDEIGINIRRQHRAHALEIEWEKIFIEGKKDLFGGVMATSSNSNQCEISCVIMPAFFNQWDKYWYIDLGRRLRFNNSLYFKSNKAKYGSSDDDDDDMKNYVQIANKEASTTITPIPDIYCVMNWTSSPDLRGQTVPETRDKEFCHLLSKFSTSSIQQLSSSSSHGKRLLIGHGQGANAILRYLGNTSDSHRQQRDIVEKGEEYGVVIIGAGYSKMFREMNDNHCEAAVFNGSGDDKYLKNTPAESLIVPFNYAEIIKNVC